MLVEGRSSCHFSLFRRHAVLRPKKSTTELPAKVRPILLQLLDAAEYADVCQAPETQFAVEIDDLLGNGATKSEIRLLQRMDLVVHKLETTSHGDDLRSFTDGGALLTGASCFVLSSRGQISAQQLAQKLLETVQDEAKNLAATPHWDPTVRQLSYRGQVIKLFRTPAQNQEAVLEQFAVQGWPTRIESPFSASGSCTASRTLSDTIKCLNRYHRNENVLRFHGDGTGKGVVWMEVPSSPVEVFADRTSNAGDSCEAG